MSNHWGSHLLNAILKLMEARGIFEQIGREATPQLVFDILKIANRNDCNPGEILDEIGGRIGICYICLKVKSEFKEDICLECRREGQYDDDSE